MYLPLFPYIVWKGMCSVYLWNPYRQLALYAIKRCQFASSQLTTQWNVRVTNGSFTLIKYELQNKYLPKYLLFEFDKVSNYYF